MDIYNTKQTLYAVYMVVYFGGKIPPKTKKSTKKPRRYIGSTKLQNIHNGYRGSVTSKKYKEIWKNELNESFNKFKIRILSVHHCDIEAREEEKRIQIKHDVVKSDLYINLAIASPNGYFGKPDTGRKVSLETREKMSEKRKGKTYEEIFGEEKAKLLKEKRKKQAKPNKGIAMSKEQKKKISDTKKGKRMWITNGLDDKMIEKTKKIPCGWYRGRTNHVASAETTSFARKETKEKIKKTKLEKYGDENYNGRKS